MADVADTHTHAGLFRGADYQVLASGGGWEGPPKEMLNKKFSAVGPAKPRPMA